MAWMLQRLPKRRRALLSTLLFALVSTATGCGSFADFILLHPSHQPVDTAGERIALDGDLEAFYLEAPFGEPEFFILALTGNAGRAESMIAHSAAMAWQVVARGPSPKFGLLSLQYPGFGGSGGSATLAGLAPAAEIAYRSLRRRAGQRPILVHGLSMGTTCALHLARTLPATEPVGFIIEKPPHLWSQILWQHGWWNLWLLSLPVALSLPDSVCSADNAAAANSLPSVWLIAEDDGIVPPAYSRAVAEAYAGPKRVLHADTHHVGRVSAENCPGLFDALAWLLREATSRGRTASVPSGDEIEGVPARIPSVLVEPRRR